jgi:hypothetical protein
LTHRTVDDDDGKVFNVETYFPSPSIVFVFSSLHKNFFSRKKRKLKLLIREGAKRRTWWKVHSLLLLLHTSFFFGKFLKLTFAKIVRKFRFKNIWLLKKRIENLYWIKFAGMRNKKKRGNLVFGWMKKYTVKEKERWNVKKA